MMLMVMMTVEKMYLFALESIELLRTCAVNSLFFFRPNSDGGT